MAAVTAVDTVPVRQRIGSLDVLRGIAILGTLASNVWLFAVPGGALAWFSGALVAQDPVEAGLRLASNGKFLALLTLLFGVGIELQYRSAILTRPAGSAGCHPPRRRGARWPGRYPVRALILLVEGLLHYLLVFEFDVLMGYAIASFLVAYLVGRSDRAVRAWITGVGAAYVVIVLAPRCCSRRRTGRLPRPSPTRRPRRAGRPRLPRGFRTCRCSASSSC